VRADRFSIAAGAINFGHNLLILLPKADTIRIETKGYALALEDVLNGRRDIFVFTLDQVRALLDNGDFAPESPVHLREFQADVAATYDDKMARKEIDIHHGAVGEVSDLVETMHLRHPRTPAYVDEYSLCLQPLRADAHFPGGLEGGVALIHCAVFQPPQHGFDRNSRIPRHFVLPGFNAFHIDAHRATDDHAELGGSADCVGGVRACDHGLCGCAACVHARAAE
jgi:hypothetical protein